MPLFAMPDVSVIIISFNTRAMTLECLRTLFVNLGGLSSEVLVVDNASRDGSVEAIRETYPQVRVIEAGGNIGFGAANNRALAEARGKYFLLLNSDAFPHAQAIPRLAEYLDTHPKAGLVGPRLLNADGTLQRSCFRFPTPWRNWTENLWISRLFANHATLGDYRTWAHDTEREVDFVVGACMLLRREVVDQSGGFDPRFFMYQEEADWERRIQAAGWKVVFFPGATVTHLGGGSGKDEPARINRHFFDSLDLYELKHHGWWGFVATRIAMLIGCSLRTPLWLGAALLPRRRSLALTKVKLLRWLLRRQLCTGRPLPAVHPSEA